MPVITAMTTISAITPTVTPPSAIHVISDRRPSAATGAEVVPSDVPVQSVQSSILNIGKRITSRIDGWLAITIKNRSTPIPTPPVGGIPYSRARM